MKRYRLTIKSKNRLELLGKLTTMLTQKQLTVVSLHWDVEGEEIAAVNVECLVQKEEILKRLKDQIMGLFDMVDAYYIEIQ